MIVLLILVTAIVVVSAARLWSTIAHDGLGVRPAPRSHPCDPFGGTLSS